MATKRFNFKFHCEKDADIIKRLADQENMQDYIRLLIRSDILADSINLTMATPDQEKEHARQDYFNSHCKALSDPDGGDYCESCPYIKYPVLGTDDRVCTIDANFETFWRNFCHGTN